MYEDFFLGLFMDFLRKPLYVILIPTLLFSYCAEGSVDPYAGTYEVYTVKQDSEGVYSARIPKPLVDSMKLGVLKLARNLISCESSESSYTNPLIGRKTTYSMSKKSRGCHLLLYHNQIYQYDCYLSKSHSNSLSLAMLNRSSTDELLGDWSNGEKKVLMNTNVCKKSLVN